MKATRILFSILGATLVSPALAQEKVKFEPKFTKDVAFYQQVSTTVEQKVTVQGGSEVQLKHSQVFQFKWLPIKQEGDKWTVELFIEGMKLNVDIATNQVKYDSASTSPDGGGANNPALAEFFRNLKETKFTITFGKGGVVEKVEGKDDFMKRLGVANPQMENILKKILSDESLKEMSDPMAGLTCTTGDKAVNEGWEKKSNLPLGPIGSYDRTLKFTYKAKEASAPGNENVHRVETTVDMAYKAPTEGTDGLLFRIKTGKLEPFNPKPGFFRFDVTKGYVKEAELTVNLKGTLTVALGNNTETTVDLLQTQTTTIQTRDNSFNVIAGPTPGPGVPPVPPKK